MNLSNIRPKKALGQNFLIDEEALSDIANSITVADKHIIEVGPGYGALTEYLIQGKPTSLDLVELDGDMIELLEKRFLNEERSELRVRGEGTVWVMIKANESKSEASTEWVWLPLENFGTFGYKSTEIGVWIRIHHTNILKFTPPYKQYSVIANIPYYITSPILFHFLYPETHLSGGEELKAKGSLVFEQNPPPPPSAPPLTRRFNSPEEMVIMMQQEVGEKILEWRARKPHHSLLSLAMEQACDDIEMVRYVGKESFHPAPKVDSIVLKFTVRKDRNREKEDALIHLWKIAFTHPRKTLLSNLKWHYDIEVIKKWLTDCRYDEKVRAEAVRREDWGKLINL
jgi:16S rRNA (adenine1518-N6/adenine1519-N6)-dimethyltransferase